MSNMKFIKLLKNKKTGEIGKLDLWYGHYEVIDSKFLSSLASYNSLSDLLKEWEEVDD